MIRFDDPHAVKLISEYSHIQYVPRLHRSIAEYDSNDVLRGGVLFTDWMGGSVQVHVAGFRQNWASRALLYLTFHYPFMQLNITKLIGLVPEWNWRARNLNLHLGFTLEHRLADVFGHADGVNGMDIMSMRKENCRWLTMRPPKIETAPVGRTNRFATPIVLLPEVRTLQ
jgi:hypothetical protein